MNRTLVLIRHAHRDKLDGGRADNGLSPKGRRQAERLLEHFHDAFPRARPLLVSSPKRRCIETILPIAGEKPGFIASDDKLNEGSQLRKRSKAFIRWWKANGKDLTVACSHGDLLPVMLEELTGAKIDLSKGGWAQVELVKGKPRLTWLFQEL